MTLQFSSLKKTVWKQQVKCNQIPSNKTFHLTFDLCQNPLTVPLGDYDIKDEDDEDDEDDVDFDGDNKSDNEDDEDDVYHDGDNDYDNEDDVDYDGDNDDDNDDDDDCLL